MQQIKTQLSFFIFSKNYKKITINIINIKLIYEYFHIFYICKFFFEVKNGK